jgi:hypothetical protein
MLIKMRQESYRVIHISTKHLVNFFFKFFDARRHQFLYHILIIPGGKIKSKKLNLSSIT